MLFADITLSVEDVSKDKEELEQIPRSKNASAIQKDCADAFSDEENQSVEDLDIDLPARDGHELRPEIEAHINGMTSALAHGDYQAAVLEFYYLSDTLKKLSRLLDHAGQGTGVDYSNYFQEYYHGHMVPVLSGDALIHKMVLQKALQHRLDLARRRSDAAGIANATLLNDMMNVFSNHMVFTSNNINLDEVPVSALAGDDAVFNQKELKLRGLNTACENYLAHLQKDISRLFPFMRKNIMSDMRAAQKNTFDIKSVAGQVVAAEINGAYVNPKLKLAVKKYLAVTEMQATLKNNEEPLKTRLLAFQDKFNKHKDVIESRRDNAGTRFLKIVATVLTIFISPLTAFGIWGVRGEAFNNMVSDLIPDDIKQGCKP